MNKKLITMTAVYSVIMVVLLILTFNYSWNPSGYSYNINDSTLTIQDRMADSDPTTVEMTDQMSDVLLFQVAVSDVKSHWHTDLIMIALFFPFILFAIFKETRPFKTVIPYKWFVGIIAAIIVIYIGATVPSYVSQIQEVEERVQEIDS